MKTSLLHPDNPFAAPYPLAELARLQPELSAWLRETPAGLSVDFAKPEAVLALNTALLRWQYGLTHYQVPAGYLCPAVPGRLDYLLYVRDLLKQSNGGKTVPAKAVQLLDVGCGANLVYSLLAVLACKWHVLASDINDQALAHGRSLLAANQLNAQIRLCHQTDANQLFTGVLTAGDYLDVTVCNPPFHQDSQSAAAGSLRKQQGLGLSGDGLNFAGQANELWCDGGERGFLLRMIAESRQFGSQVYWFTSLVSKADNLKVLQQALTNAGATQQQVIPMQQGNKQSRILCWSFLTPAQQQLWQQHRWRR